MDLKLWEFLSPMCQLMFSEAWGRHFIIHCPYSGARAKKKRIPFVSTVVSFMGNFPIACLTLQPQIKGKEEIAREMFTVKCSASLKTLS